MQGLESLPLVVIPHPVAGRDAEEVRRMAREAFSQVLAALMKDR